MSPDRWIEPTEDQENRLDLPKAKSKQVLWRRGHSRWKRPKIDPKESYALARKDLRLEKWGVIGLAKEFAPLVLAARERLFERVEVPPSPIVPDVEGVLACIVAYGAASRNKAALSHLVDAWMAMSTPAVAVESLLKCVGLVASRGVFERNSPRLQDDAADQKIGALIRLRAWLSAADEVSYREALDVGRQHLTHDVSTSVPSAVAFLFPTEGLADAVLDRWDNKSYPVSYSNLALTLLGGAIQDSSQLATYLRKSSFFPPAFIWTLVDLLGADALPAVTAMLDPEVVAEVLSVLPSDAAVVALFERTRTRGSSPWLRDMVLRFPRRAVRCLLPHAMGEHARVAREHLTIVARRFPNVIETIRSSVPPSDALALDRLLEDTTSTETRPSVPSDSPSTARELPPFVVVELLPPPVLKDGSGSLNLAAVTALAHTLRRSTLKRPDAGVEEARVTCDRASLLRFAWALAEQWVAAGAPRKQHWALEALGHFGDDDTARQLFAHYRPFDIPDILAAIGTEVARMYLSYEQVPELGLDRDGRMVLNYGSRHVTIAFDDRLHPFALDENGRRHASLPEPLPSDDPARVAVAKKRWADLNEDARTVVAMQTRRLTHAMRSARRWSTAAWRDFVEHPLLFQLARGVVWGVYEGAQPVASFRIREDRALVDSNDRPYRLEEGTLLGVPHRIELGEPLAAAWRKVFAERGIAATLLQLDRDVHELLPEERSSNVINRWSGRTVAASRLLALNDEDGWYPASDADDEHGRMSLLVRSCGAGVGELRLRLMPGLKADPRESDPQQLGDLILTGGVTKARLDMSSLGAVRLSEALRDITGLFE